MNDLKIEDVSDDFAQCWNFAAKHIQEMITAYTGGDPQKGGWIKASLTAPFLEHLSFRIGNQLFFVHVEDVFGQVLGPGTRDGLMHIAKSCGGHACIMPMRRRRSLGLQQSGESWMPVRGAWGLVAARTAREVEPPALVTDARIEITDWELHDLAIQIIRRDLEQRGRMVISWQSDPAIDPSVWFMGDAGPEWVVVRSVRHPVMSVSAPDSWADIVRRMKAISPIGHFAWVVVAHSAEALEAGSTVPAEPIWRGAVTHVKYDGIA